MSVIAPSTFDFLAVNDDLAGIAHIAYFALSNEPIGSILDFCNARNATIGFAGQESIAPSPLNMQSPRAFHARLFSTLLR